MKLYTKTGDGGETSLVGETRVKKNSARVAVYGEMDELNCIIGLLRSYLDDDSAYALDCQVLTHVQSALFVLGSNLACESGERTRFKIPAFELEWVETLATAIDRHQDSLEPLKTFILPGGRQGGAQAHVARAVCRRIERSLVDYQISNPSEVPEGATAYLNRLSDYFFALARTINANDKVTEIPWP